MRRFVSSLLALFCTGCATVPPPTTASGKPEVTIAGVLPEKIKPVLVSQMLNGGYRITKDTPYELSFDRPVQNIAVAVLMGSKYDAQPNVRVSYIFAPIGNATRVVADLAIITNPGSAFERRTDVNAGVDSHDVQVMLDQVRGELDPTSPIAIARENKIVLGVGLMDAARAKVAGMEGPDRGLYVITTNVGSVGEKAGLSKGDVIMEFGGRKTNTLPDLAAAQAATKPGSTVQLALWRHGTEETISVSFPAEAVSKRPAKKEKIKSVGAI